MRTNPHAYSVRRDRQPPGPNASARKPRHQCSFPHLRALTPRKAPAIALVVAKGLRPFGDITVVESKCATRGQTVAGRPAPLSPLRRDPPWASQVSRPRVSPRRSSSLPQSFGTKHLVSPQHAFTIRLSHLVLRRGADPAWKQPREPRAGRPHVHVARQPSARASRSAKLDAPLPKSARKPGPYKLLLTCHLRAGASSRAVPPTCRFLTLGRGNRLCGPQAEDTEGQGCRARLADLAESKLPSPGRESGHAASSRPLATRPFPRLTGDPKAQRGVHRPRRRRPVHARPGPRTAHGSSRGSGWNLALHSSRIGRSSPARSLRAATIAPLPKARRPAEARESPWRGRLTAGVRGPPSPRAARLYLVPAGRQSGSSARERPFRRAAKG